ncbi:MAG: vanadium-dependent haloperoxidase, partial [Flavobacteriales bacterium]|nr:vanadium-dependent haloperoxidase [Flavobacteriales bacterium]
MSDLGYDTDVTSTDYINDGPAALGNYIGEQMIAYGLQDGANEANDYANIYYNTVNVPMIMDNPGNPNMLFPNRWQRLWITQFIDQAGNPVAEIPDFLSPEWGDTNPFALTEDDLTVNIDFDTGQEWNTWMDPGAPPYLDPLTPTCLDDDNFKWGHAMVAVWSGHLDHTDGVMWDISPASIGNVDPFPTSFDDYDQFYDFYEGGDASNGWTENPVTQMPYEEQLIPRGDYGRILAEFWADGPDSETPPGHWFTILNYVTDHPDNTFQWMGQGDPLDPLEWDLKTYLVLAGNMHDCAVAAWSIKGFYDYARPVSVIRYMAEKGQCTDPFLDNYHPAGIPLIPDHIEVVETGDPLAGFNDENVGKIKVYAWRGPDFIINPNSVVAGVDWILAEKWWPYQRPTFVTPPFAGYVSGHSTFSRGAAEVMELMTGTPYFPGGMGVFQAPQNEFLVFEDGPSMDCELEWATYRDASDQCSLSRIWGGIHPPADDIPGRVIGAQIGPQAFNHAMSFITANPPKVEAVTLSSDLVTDASLEAQLTVTVEYNEPMDIH